MSRVFVLLQPMGSTEVGDIVDASGIVEGSLPVNADVKPVIWRIPTPLDAFNFDRMQFDARLVAERLSAHYSGFIEPGSRLVVGIADADGYVNGLNFVFGLALPGAGAAVVFTRRLRRGVRRSIYMERLVKEVLHELGHLLGLGHCRNPECVMSFSNSLADVDSKRPWFCPSCRAMLARRYGLRAVRG